MRRKQAFSFWGFVIAVLILVFFSVQNAQEVGFRFFVWKTRLPLSVLLIVAFLLGLITGTVFSFRRSRSDQKKEDTKATTETDNLSDKEFESFDNTNKTE
jgi:uncharacterized integral membrane protein